MGDVESFEDMTHPFNRLARIYEYIPVTSTYKKAEIIKSIVIDVKRKNKTFENSMEKIPFEKMHYRHASVLGLMVIEGIYQIDLSREIDDKLFPVERFTVKPILEISANSILKDNTDSKTDGYIKKEDGRKRKNIFTKKVPKIVKIVDKISYLRIILNDFNILFERLGDIMLIGVLEKSGKISSYLSEKFNCDYIDADILLKKIADRKGYLDIEELLSNVLISNQLELLLEIELLEVITKYNNEENLIIKSSFLSDLKLFNNIDFSINVENDKTADAWIFEYNKKNKITSKKKFFSLTVNMNENWKTNIDNYLDFNYKNGDLVSIVVPIYNTSEYLLRCIETIRKQTYRNLEILLINDGSTDNSLNICNYLAKLDKRIKVISQANKGLSETRNVGIDNATGEYICFIDSDDYIEYSMIEELLKRIKETNSDVCECSFYIHQRDGSIKDVTIEQKGNKIIYGKLNLVNAYSDATILIPAWDKMYRLSSIKNIKFTNDCFKEDSDYIYRLCLSEKSFSLVAKPLYHYIKRQKNSITSDKISPRLFSLRDWGIEKYNELISMGEVYADAANKILYNSLVHILRYYMRDYNNKVLDNNEYSKQIQIIVNDIIGLLLLTENLNGYRKLDEVLDIINYLSQKKAIDDSKFPTIEIPCIGIIWNSMNDNLKREAIEILEKQVTIVEMYQIDFKDEYKNFIKDIYCDNHEFDGIPILKAGSLIERYDSNEIVILNMIVKVSNITYFSKLKGFMYEEIANLKSEIRKHFKTKINDYAYDNVFHMTVDLKEYINTKEICDKYRKMIVEKTEDESGKIKKISR